MGSADVAFFGVKDQGTKVVFVIDRSGSMSTHDSLSFAKRELMVTLSQMDSNQEFQIILYNNAEPVAMAPRDKPSAFYRATEINRALARQFLDPISPELGTNHLPALLHALRMKPDVVYFLTDSGEPELDSEALAQVRKANKGQTRIHCIEFGVWSNLTPENFLKRLADDSGGTYSYRDVTKFDNRRAAPR
jgi:hypothetical protein